VTDVQTDANRDAERKAELLKRVVGCEAQVLASLALVMQHFGATQAETRRVMNGDLGSVREWLDSKQEQP
jgi:hypothetical protein